MKPLDTKNTLLTLVLAVVIIIFAYLGETDQITEVGNDLGANANNSLEISTDQYKVSKVVDGDTAKLIINGQEETIRIIGLNTPETVDPRKPVECFGFEASDKAKELLQNQVVYFEPDPTQTKTDRYGRLLGYIFLPDGQNYSEYMIRNGYGYEYTYKTPYKYQAAFIKAQEQAQAEQIGLWSEGVCKNI